MVADPWSGYLIPIVYDPIIGELNSEDYNFDFSSNDMILLLNKGSLFQQKKLEKLNKILNSGILENLITTLNNKNDQIKISENRDVEALLNNFDILCVQSRLENLYNKNFKRQNTLVIGRAITNFNQLIKYIFEFIKLNSISELSFVYLVGPNFIKPNMDLLKSYFGTKYEIYYDSYHYEYDLSLIHI